MLFLSDIAVNTHISLYKMSTLLSLVFFVYDFGINFCHDLNYDE